MNLSAAVLMSAALHRRLERLGPAVLSQMIVELTEHEQVRHYPELAAALAPWRAQGLRLAVDDTGAGHSSLTHVLRLRPDVVKLDRELVAGVDRDPVRRGLVRALTEFCADAAVLLVAEGVETEPERLALADVGVRFAQGFHLGRPRLASPAASGLAPG